MLEYRQPIVHSSPLPNPCLFDTVGIVGSIGSYKLHRKRLVPSSVSYKKIDGADALTQSTIHIGYEYKSN